MITYVQGSDWPTGFEWRDGAGDLVPFATGYTFSLQLGPAHKSSVISFTKTTGITGADTSPNVTVAWATAGELNTLEPGVYTLVIFARETATGRDRPPLHTEIEIIDPFTAGGSVLPATGGVVCTLWAQPAELPTGPWTADEARTALTIASDTLYAFSGRQFPGICADTVRPCAYRAGFDAPPVVIPGFGTASRSRGVLWGTCGCADGIFGSCVRSRIRLGPEPVVSITQVRIDGEIINPATYQIDEWRYLAAIPDPVTGAVRSWPCCQRLDAPATEAGTFEVVLAFGAMPPPGGKAAAIGLGLQILKAGSPDCKLPANTQTVVRQQVSQQLLPLDPAVMFDKGHTGITLVDRWISAVNPYHVTEPGRVLSPDARPVSVHVDT